MTRRIAAATPIKTADSPNVAPVRMTVAVVLAFLLTAPVGAIAATARETFRQGVEAAREDDYHQAIEHFEAARRAGLDTGALHFNLGVARYRVGQLDEAQAAFRRAVDSGSMVAPAYYQLGRIARERGDSEQARAHFRRASRAATTDSLRQRARSALAALDPSPAAPDYVYVGFGGGHDSNIALTPSDASGVSEESDWFLDAVLVGRWPAGDRTYLRGSAYMQQYFDDGDFDLMTLRGGVGRVGRIGGDGHWDVWVDGRHQRFGGDAFENAALAGVRLRRPLNVAWSLELDYRFELARGASGFDFLDGVEHRFDVSLDERGRTGWDLSAGVGVSDREDRETADDFFSFSWHEVSLTGDYTFRLDADHHLTLSGDWRNRDYDGDEIRNGTRFGERDDDLVGLGITLDRRLGGQWNASVGLRAERRDSSLGEFDFDREIARIRIERVF